MLKFDLEIIVCSNWYFQLMDCTWYLINPILFFKNDKVTLRLPSRTQGTMMLALDVNCRWLFNKVNCWASSIHVRFCIRFFRILRVMKCKARIHLVFKAWLIHNRVWVGQIIRHLWLSLKRCAPKVRWLTFHKGWIWHCLFGFNTDWVSFIFCSQLI